MRLGGLPETAIFQGAIGSSSEINRLKGESNQRITQETDEMCKFANSKGYK